METVLYPFAGGNDGFDPRGDLIFDHAGNIYGTTADSEPYYGTVFQLTPSGAAWTKSILYSFTGAADGATPSARVIFDQAGNLYGTTGNGGYNGCNQGCGVVYQLTPSGSGWTENVLYAFQGGSDGEYLRGGVIFDRSGNIYGGTYQGGSGGGGTVFELTPSDGTWSLGVLHGFSGQAGVNANLAMDTAGNLYGATVDDGAFGNGSVFKLTPTGSGWTYTDLYDFTGSGDGQGPLGNVIVDANGNIYGTTYLGGAYGYGVVWELRP